VPFLFLTAHDDRRIVGQAVEHGAHSYLLKPVKIAEVLPQVEAGLSRAAEARNLGRAATETRLINVAVGILMAEYRLTREGAAERLRSICRPRRLEASEAAEEIVNAFEAFLRVSGDFRELTAESANGGGSR
jgi:two-component system, response regulator PdtaR